MQKSLLSLLRLGLFLLAYGVLSSVYAQQTANASLRCCETEAICAGDEAQLAVDLTGTPPFVLTYTDGGQQFTAEVNDLVAFLTVQPEKITTYKLLSVSDANGAGSVCGETTIGVNNCNPQGKRDCSTTAYETEIISQETEGDCTTYTLEISHDGDARYGLSHFNIAVACGTISQVSNSGGWAMEIGTTDPTTGITGIKIDDIQNFGESSSPESFTVTYTICNTGCTPRSEACELLVAYKASTCVNYEEVKPPYVPMELSLQATDNPCFEDTLGKISSQLSGGSAPYTYSWSNGAGTEQLENVAAGTYTLTVTDAAGESISATATVNQPEALVGSIAAAQPSCNESNGALNLSVSGGTAPYQFSWSNGATTEDLENRPAGAYQVEITDANGCSLVLSEELMSSDAPSVSIAQAAACEGGTLSATTTGGTAPYTYSWNTGAAESSLTPETTGTYSVTVTDANGCSATEEVTVEALGSEISLSGITTDVICRGGAEGSIDLTVSGGEAPYTYSWSNGATTEDVGQLSAGTYTVTVTDASGCFVSAQYSISQPRSLFIHVTEQQNPDCHGNLGSVSVSTNYGTEPYTYEWSNGATGDTVTDLEPGFYSVTVTDANGCQYSRTIQIQEANVPQVNISGGDCADPNLTATASGGTAPYTYEWNTGDNTSSLTPDTAGTYTVTITDANGCTATATAEAGNPADAIDVSLTANSPSCYGDADGSIDLEVSGGSGTYEVSWEDGSTTEDRDGLSGGTYTVTVSDANGCTVTKSVTLEQPRRLYIRADEELPVSCDGSSLGSISLSAYYGTAPYSFYWSHGAEGSTVTDLEAGFYTVTVVDANGCQRSRTFQVQQATAAQVTIASSGSCEEATLSADLQGGTAPYTYSWNTGATSASINPVAAGGYSVVVTDASGCTAEASITYQPAEGISLAVETTDASCYGAADGTADLQVSKGTAPYTFDWTNGAQTEDITGLSAGVYSVIVRDAAGCEATLAFNIAQPEALQLVVEDKTDASCGQENGALNIAVSGGNAPYTYLWSDGDTAEDRIALAAGEYSVQVTDASGCTAEAVFTVEEEAAVPPTAILANCGDQLLCRGESLEAMVSFTGTAPYTLSYALGSEVHTVTTSESTYALNLSPGESEVFSLVSVSNICAEGTAEGQLNIQVVDCEPACQEDCFTTDVVALQEEESCTTYTLRVSTDGSCAKDLSHFNIAVGCGLISDVWNSEGWKIELNTDPTTGITGIKIDNIPEFGKQAGDYFEVRYTLCSTAACELTSDAENCNGPVVAYKAGTCVTYDQAGMNLGSSAPAVAAKQSTTAETPEYQLSPNPLYQGQRLFVGVENLPAGATVSVRISNLQGVTVSAFTKTVNPGDGGFYLEDLQLASGLYVLQFEVAGQIETARLQVY